MPLNAQTELCTRLFYRLHDAIFAEGGKLQLRRETVNGLVMLAVHQNRVPPQQMGEQGAPPHCDRVHLGPVVVVGHVLKRLDVLLQGAAQYDIHHLNAPADAQHRLVRSAASRRRFGSPQAGMRSCP